MKNIFLILLSTVCLSFANSKMNGFSMKLAINTVESIKAIVTNDTVKGKDYMVTVTMYYATVGQCDDSPLITADGTKIDPLRASEQRMVAVSRDLLKVFNYGDFVEIKGTNGQDGIYQVHDTMNKRIVSTIDILETVNSKPYKFKNITIRKVCFS